MSSSSSEHDGIAWRQKERPNYWHQTGRAEENRQQEQPRPRPRYVTQRRVSVHYENDNSESYALRSHAQRVQAARSQVRQRPGTFEKAKRVTSNFSNIGDILSGTSGRRKKK